MKAVIGNTVLAEAPTNQLVRIEGNWYFPPSSLTGKFEKSPTAYHSPWKGDAQYWNVGTEEGWLEDGAWSYPDPMPSAFEKVDADFSNYVAFDRRITVME